MLLSAMLAGCGGGADSPPGGPAPDPVHIVAPGVWVVLGSSTAAGVGAPAGQGWVASLADQVLTSGVAVKNLARSGLLSSQALPTGSAVPAGRPPPDPAVNVDAALAEVPTLLLLAFPSNDTVAGVPASQTVAAWRTIAAHAAAAGGASTLVLGTQPRAGLSASQQAAQRDIDEAAAAAFGACFVPLQESLAGPDGALAPAFDAGDGVHLNGDGHARVHARVAEVLASGRCVAVPA